MCVAGIETQATISTAHDRGSPRALSSIALQKRVDALEVIYEAAPIGLFLCDQDCRLISVNQFLADIDGSSVDEHTGRFVWDIVPALRAQEPVLRRVLKTGQGVLREEVLDRYSPDSNRWWKVSYHPVISQGGSIVALCGVVDDITERKSAEIARTYSAGQLRRLSDANLVGVATADATAVAEANDALLEIIGYARSDLTRNAIPWSAIVSPDDLSKGRACLEQLKTSGVCPAFEVQFLRKDGARIPVLIGGALLDREPMRWVAFVIDLRGQKNAELRALDIAREMAHRVKNLMAVVTAIAHQLALTCHGFEEFDEKFVARLQALGEIQDILLQENWRGANLRQLILSQLTHCSDLLEHRIVLQGPDVWVNAVVSQPLGMAFYELCTNALKHGALSNDSGIVTVRWNAGSGPFRIEWIESGGPAVGVPSR